MSKHSPPRRPRLQLQRMAQRWPDLECGLLWRFGGGNRPVSWRGPLRGFQREHTVEIIWHWWTGIAPSVFVLDPLLRPRSGEAFADIPHLQYDGEKPEGSSLCLFDPENGEWSPAMWISDTTVPWASAWLHHYECWHYDGVWRGPNAPGPISAGEMMRQREECGDGEGA